jgi:Ni/Co efflux regulator RcnB
MSFKVFLTAAVAATLGLGSMASFAQSHGQRGQVIAVQQQADNRHNSKNGDRRHDRRDERRSDRHDDRRSDRYSNSHRRNDRHEQRAHGQRHYYHGARGPEFARGHAIPRQLRTHQYVVINPRQHRLSVPPRGHQWVQVGADYVLVAVATGIIASIILNH